MTSAETATARTPVEWLAIYAIGGLILGSLAALIVFAGGWLYCIATYGFFIGVCAGWIPAAICAAIVGALVRWLWPLLMIGVLALAIRASGTNHSTASVNEVAGADPLPITTTTAPAPTAPANTAAPPPDPKEIERAQADFARMVGAGGIAADVTATMTCYGKLAATSSWSEWDYCAALDLAGQRASEAAGQQYGDLGRTAYFSSFDVSRRQSAAASTVGGGFNDTSDRVAALRAIFDQQASEAAAKLQAAQAAPAAEAQPTSRPSFDCAGVHSDVLKLVCSTPSLGEADQQMAAAYRDALGKAPSVPILKASQQEWVSRRNNATADVQTLAAMYSLRTEQLEKLATDGALPPAN